MERDELSKWPLTMDMENLTASVRGMQISQHRTLADEQRTSTSRGACFVRQHRARPNRRGKKAGRRQNQKGRGQHSNAVSFTRMVTAGTGKPPRKTANGGRPVGYLGRTALTERRNGGVRSAPRRRLILGNRFLNTFPRQRVNTQQYLRWRRGFLFNRRLSYILEAEGKCIVGHKHGYKSKGQQQML
jgi:hypothetical protein